MEVINVKEAREYVSANYPNDPLLKHIVLNLLDQLPKTKAVEVVKCEDCADHGRCPIEEYLVNFLEAKPAYCAAGERRINGNNQSESQRRI